MNPFPPATPNIGRLLPLVLLTAAMPVAFSQVVPPAKREAALSAARQLLEAKDATLPDKVANPFSPGTFGSTVPTAPTDGSQTDPAGGTPTQGGQRSGRDLLAAIADAIPAPNLITFGGRHILVFGQKRVKAGEFLTINFEGKDHNLEISAIDRTSFTLRLNREEYTRPIK